jgi:hypothetical protein
MSNLLERREVYQRVQTRVSVHSVNATAYRNKSTVRKQTFEAQPLWRERRLILFQVPAMQTERSRSIEFKVCAVRHNNCSAVV